MGFTVELSMNDTQHNDTQQNGLYCRAQHNDTRHNDTQHNDTQQNGLYYRAQHE
jgi:hypothetical protein